MENKILYVALTLVSCFCIFLLIGKKPQPTEVDKIVAKQTQYDSIRIADMQATIDNLLSENKRVEAVLDSLQSVKSKNLNTYINESNTVRNLPMSERIRLFTKELDTPDSIGWR
jgi:hypothetical protein